MKAEKSSRNLLDDYITTFFDEGKEVKKYMRSSFPMDDLKLKEDTRVRRNVWSPADSE